MKLSISPQAALLAFLSLTSATPLFSRPSTALAKRAVDKDKVDDVIRDKSTTLNVETNSWKYLNAEQQQYPKYLGTAGLDGCTGVAVCSDTGCYLGHFLPDQEDSPDNKWKTHLDDGFSERRNAFEGGKATIVAAKTGEYEYKWEVDQIKKWLDEKSIPYEEKPYHTDYGEMDPEEAAEIDIPQENINQEQVALGTILITNSAKGVLELQVEGNLA
ncbi:hypothetical protein AC579_10620 [Pseudocercospora musae]|uniref:Uncharacterized protein n=1 Tax=Pseudocercospora musae TaxID=113226 RepID=A0A139ILP4_9PEZI|nr:hypothetical protein AC579_10620 [Pseudocercospora musae]